MEPNAGYNRGFKIKHDKGEDRFHIGIFFCIDYKDIMGKRDKYLFICPGLHDFSIGIMSDYGDQSEWGY